MRPRLPCARLVLAALLAAVAPVGRGQESDYDAPRQVCRVSDPRLSEASGLAASHRHPGYYYTHNDSGGRPEVYLLDRRGRIYATIVLRGAENFDYEDIALAPAAGGRWEVCVADIGDNLRQRRTITIYRFAEPALPPSAGQTIALVPRVLRGRYPDGPHDAEGFAVDPRDGVGYVLTKQRSGACRVYRLPTWTAEDPVELQYVGQLRFPPGTLPLARMVTAADFAPDGRRFAVRSYVGGWEWRLAGHGRRGASQPASRPGRPPAFLRRVPEPLILPAEPQGEALCYGPAGHSLLTISEGSPTILYEIRRLGQRRP